MIAIFPEIAAAAAGGDPEKLAILVRQYFGDQEVFAPRPDVVMILRNVGLAVENLPIDGHGALLAKDEQGRFTIVAVVGGIAYAAGDASVRFLLAHMLGHYLLDVQPLIARGDWQVSGYRETACPARRYGAFAELADSPTSLAQARELKADQFAAALLMPVGMLRRAMQKLRDDERVAQFFGVTRACVARRASDVGLSTGAPVNFLHAEAKLSGGQARMASDSKTFNDIREDSLSGCKGSEVSMPRSYAASTYGQSARSITKNEPIEPRHREEPRQKSFDDDESQQQAVKPQASQAGRGMERLREIARRLDKNRQ